MEKRRRLLLNEKMNDCADGLRRYGEGDISFSVLVVFFLYFTPFFPFIFLLVLGAASVFLLWE